MKLKVNFRMLIISVIFMFSYNNIQAQFLNKVTRNIEKKVNKEAEERTKKHTDKAIDDAFDALEEGINGEDQNHQTSDSQNQTKPASNTTTVNKQNSDNQAAVSIENQNTEAPQKMDVKWSNYDFVPGDEVIFEDGPSIDEENGEFPSRWDLVSGQVEIAEVNGEMVLMFIDGNPKIVPYLENSSEDYLPEVFTIEFDYYKPAKGNRASIYLYDYKNQKKLSSPNNYMDISYNSVNVKLDNINGEEPSRDYKWNDKGVWTHIAIAYTKGKLKVYMDDVRVINIPHFTGNPAGLTLEAYWADLGADKPFYFKNIRIAKGGVKYYDRVLSEGKIIVNGIRFDVNKATIKPESMGAINKIYKLMNKHPEVKFSVEGHTDSDGDDTRNQQLSEDRAQAVMNQLIAMGISADRLKFKGFGESQPIDNNTTAEGKANNRRVEFVKF